MNLIDLFKNYEIAQNYDELRWLIRKVEDISPTAILEVGVAKGGTLKVWEELLRRNGKGKENILIGIDIDPHVSWDISKSDINVTVITNNSHDESTLQQVKEILKDRRLDFIYIDGEHTNEAVEKDYLMYGTLVRPNGLIGFHDYTGMKQFIDTLARLEINFGREHNPIGFASRIGTAICIK